MTTAIHTTSTPVTSPTHPTGRPLVSKLGGFGSETARVTVESELSRLEMDRANGRVRVGLRYVDFPRLLDAVGDKVGLELDFVQWLGGRTFLLEWEGCKFESRIVQL